MSANADNLRDSDAASRDAVDFARTCARRLQRFAAAAAAALTICGCTTGPEADNWCGREPWLCGAAIIGAVVAVSVIVIVDSHDNPGIGPPSDARLKRDIRAVGVLPNGLPLYAFRYWNDDRVFVGILAQDVLRDPHLHHAVHQSAGGYYLVDFAALGLSIAGSRSQFEEAGQRALREAESRM
jgi:hypothetical protein